MTRILMILAVLFGASSARAQTPQPPSQAQVYDQGVVDKLAAALSQAQRETADAYGQIAVLRQQLAQTQAANDAMVKKLAEAKSEPKPAPTP